MLRMQSHCEFVQRNLILRNRDLERHLEFFMAYYNSNKKTSTGSNYCYNNNDINLSETRHVGNIHTRGDYDRHSGYEDHAAQVEDDEDTSRDWKGSCDEEKRH